MVATVVALVALVAPATAQAERHPILFIHGNSGTGAQFESQALRFTSNGYPASWIDELDYNSPAGSANRIGPMIDAKIAELKKRTGADKIDLIGHSQGTIISFNYLIDPARGADRRAQIAHYVNVDGQTLNPGVPTLALWAGIPNGQSEDAPSDHMEGAENVTIPHQAHVQVCTSWEGFKAMFTFLTGAPPAHNITPQTGTIEISGRALTFPTNTGLAGATIEIWPLAADGRRATLVPQARASVTDGAEGGGAWGPVAVTAGVRYEFALIRDGQPTRHTYREPFVRSDDTVRLLSADALQPVVGGREGSASTAVIRYKELWGDKPEEHDSLKVEGLELCTPELCPTSRNINGYYAYDDNRNGVSDMHRIPGPGTLPFITAADVYVPATNPPSSTVTWSLRSRGKEPARKLTVPAWDSATDLTIVQWNDFEPDEIEPAAAPAAPRRRCSRTVTVRLRHRLRSGRVLVPGTRSRVIRRGARSVRLRITRKGRLTVTVRGVTRSGRKIVERHRVRGC